MSLDRKILAEEITRLATHCTDSMEIAPVEGKEGPFSSLYFETYVSLFRQSAQVVALIELYNKRFPGDSLMQKQQTLLGDNLNTLHNGLMYLLIREKSR